METTREPSPRTLAYLLNEKPHQRLLQALQKSSYVMRKSVAADRRSGKPQKLRWCNCTTREDGTEIAYTQCVVRRFS